MSTPPADPHQVAHDRQAHVSAQTLLPAFPWREANAVIDLFTQVAQINLTMPLRRGASIHLPDHGRLLIAGDIHDHMINLRKIVSLAKLDESPDHHLVLQEVIHGPHRINHRDMSIRILLQVAALKLRWPHQVHVLQSNHELAQMQRQAILKEGVSLIEAFDLGIEFLYQEKSGEVYRAMNQYLASLPLAVRCANGIFCSHSLPVHRQLATFDVTVLDRELTAPDFRHDGPVHQLVWGRRHAQDVTDHLGPLWNATQFILGHQMQGYETQGKNMLILASDHDHGAVLPIDLSRSYERDELVALIHPLAKHEEI